MQIPETEQKAMTVDLYFKRKGIKERINEGNRTYFFYSSLVEKIIFAKVITARSVDGIL